MREGTPVSDESAWTMFAVYREAREPRQYRVVYFTELDERSRETAIEHVMAGELVCEGFLPDAAKEAGKRRLETLVARLNAGDIIDLARLAATTGAGRAEHPYP